MAFSMGMAVRGLSSSAGRHAIQKVTVIGGGLMGSGIAQVAAETGHDVTLVDVSDDIVTKSRANIQKSLFSAAKKQFKNANEAEKFTSTTLSNLKLNTDAHAAVTDCHLVVEAITENFEKKQNLFKSLDRYAPGHTIFASNTLSFSIRDLARFTDRADRFGGLHFFYPVPLMKLVEVVGTKETSENTIAEMRAFISKLGRTPVQSQDTPGFIVNRLSVTYMLEAIKMYETGNVTQEDLDTAVRLAGYPVGPLQMSDYFGLDNLKLLYDGWHKLYPDSELFKPCELLNKMVAQGKHGVRTGEGFYKYQKE